MTFQQSKINLKLLVRYLFQSQHWIPLFLTLIICILELLAVFYLPAFFAKILSKKQPALVFVIFGLIWALEKSSLYLRELTFFPIINSSIRALTFDVVQKIHNLPYADYQNLSLLSLLNTIKRIGYSVRLAFKTVVLGIVPSTIQLFAVVYACHKSHPQLVIGIMACVLGSSAFLLYFLKLYLSARQKAWKTSDTVASHLGDHLLNSIWIRQNNPSAGSLVYLPLQQDMEQEWKAWNHQNTLQQFLFIVHTLIWGAGLIFLFSQATPDFSLQLITVKALFTNCYFSFKHLIVDLKNLPELTTDLGPILKILTDEPVAPTTRLGPKPKPMENPGILSVENVGDPPLSFRLYPQQSLLVQGPSGAGKSRFLKTIAGLYPLQRGEIFFTGTRIYVPQEIKLFNKTVFENLVYGLSDYDPKQLEDLIETFHLERLQANTPLSGGEQARIYLIRALLMRPQLLLLDETLHALDLEMEAKVFQKIQTLVPFIIIVSHRNSLQIHCNQTLIIGSN